LPNALPRVARRAAALLSALVLAASCGGESASVGDTSAASGAQPTLRAVAPANACALLPGSEVGGLIERAVRDTLAMQTDGGAGGATVSQCNYATAQNPAVASLMLRRSAQGETVAQGSRSARESLTQSGTVVEDVPGLGETAFWGGNQLHVFTKDGWYLIVTASDGLGIARALAERALARF
jgi:hypothetical protein